MLVQALGALGIGWALVRHGVAGWAAAAFACGAVVLVRLVINMNNFVMSSLAASPTPPAYRIGPAACLRMLAEEFCASMLVTSWAMPRGRASLKVYADSVHPPVLLVHGYGCNSGYWAHLVPRLQAARIGYATVDLEPAGGAIEAYVPLIEARVRALCEASGAAQVAIVGHSMGGLAARAWMREHGSARLARLVTLGSPHHGTVMARFGPGANAVQMRRARDGGTWLAALAAGEGPVVRSRITSLFTHHDNIVAPQDSGVLEGARNVAFGGVGHVALGSNRRVLDAVMRELDGLRQPVPH